VSKKLSPLTLPFLNGKKNLLFSILTTENDTRCPLLTIDTNCEDKSNTYDIDFKQCMARKQDCMQVT